MPKVDAALKFVVTLALGGVLGAASLWSYQFGPLYMSGTATVVDGDSIKISGENIRLAGIDAPEMPKREGKQCNKLLSRPECIQSSAIALHWRVGGETVRCWIVGDSFLSARGKWDRPLGVCFHGETELNAWMLRECHARLPADPAHRLPRYATVFTERDCRPADAPVVGLRAR